VERLLSKILNSKFFLISTFYFFYFSAVGVYVIYLPKILNNVGYNPTQIGIIFSIAPLVRFLLPFFFLKRFKLDIKVFRLSLLFLLLSVPLLYLTLENFYLFSLSILLYGATASIILPFVDIYSLELLSKEVYGKARLYGSVGFIMIALVLSKYMQNNYAGLHFIALTILFCVISAYLLTRDTNFTKEPSHLEKFKVGKHKALWISIFLMQVSFGAFYSFFTIYEKEAGLSYETISYLWTFGVLCEIALFYYQAKFLKLDLMFLMKFSIFITSIRWFMLHIFNDNIFLLYLSQSFHAFSFALYHTVTLSLLYKLYHDKNLASQFYYGLGFGLGGFFGSVIAGYFYGEYLFLFSAVTALLSYLAVAKEK
jgi:PPP family 3-phenylpropionic acid transporter